MKIFSYIGIAALVLYLAKEPGQLFWLGAISVILWYVFPEDKVEMKRDVQQFYSRASRRLR